MASCRVKIPGVPYMQHLPPPSVTETVKTVAELIVDRGASRTYRPRSLSIDRWKGDALTLSPPLNMQRVQAIKRRKIKENRYQKIKQGCALWREKSVHGCIKNPGGEKLPQAE